MIATETQLHSSTESPSDAVIEASGENDVDWVQSAIDAIGCRKDDPDYLKELFEGVAEARRRIDAEYLRDLDEQEQK